MLVAERQNRTIGKDAVEPVAGLAVDRLRQIDAADFGAGVFGQRCDRIVHRRSQPVSIGRHGSSAHSLSEAS